MPGWVELGDCQVPLALEPSYWQEQNGRSALEDPGSTVGQNARAKFCAKYTRQKELKLAGNFSSTLDRM